MSLKLYKSSSPTRRIVYWVLVTLHTGPAGHVRISLKLPESFFKTIILVNQQELGQQRTVIFVPGNLFFLVAAWNIRIRRMVKGKRCGNCSADSQYLIKVYWSISKGKFSDDTRPCWRLWRRCDLKESSNRSTDTSAFESRFEIKFK